MTRDETDYLGELLRGDALPTPTPTPMNARGRKSSNATAGASARRRGANATSARGAPSSSQGSDASGSSRGCSDDSSASKATRAPRTPPHGPTQTPGGGGGATPSSPRAPPPTTRDHHDVDDLLFVPPDLEAAVKLEGLVDPDDLAFADAFIDDVAGDILFGDGGMLGDAGGVAPGPGSGANGNGGDGGNGGNGGNGGGEEEDEEKKRARLVRNRESAQLSRQRKKQHMDELDRRCRGLQAECAELHKLAHCLSAENHRLRAHCNLVATGKTPPETPPPPPHPYVAAQVGPGGMTHMPITPMMFQPKIPLPPRGGFVAPAPAPAPAAAAAGSNAGSTPSSPARAANADHEAELMVATKKRKSNASKGVAAVTAAALAALSVACLSLGSRSGAGSGGQLALSGVALGGARRHLLAAATSGVFGGDDAAEAVPERALVAARADLLDATTRATATATAATRPPRPTMEMERPAVIPMRGGEREAIPLRGKSREVALPYDGESSIETWGATDDDGWIPTTRASSEDARFDAAGDATKDPWTAAFHRLGHNAETLREMTCREMFRFNALDLNAAGGDVAFTRRLSEAAAAEEEEEEGEREGDVKKATGARGELELPPVAIPLPPRDAGLSESSSSSLVGGSDARRPLPLPLREERRRTIGDDARSGAAAGAGAGGFGVGDDESSLVSVLLPPPAASASRVGGAMPTLSKLFVVTRSRRTSEYVTYSCRLPVVDRAAAGATAGWS